MDVMLHRNSLRDTIALLLLALACGAADDPADAAVAPPGEDGPPALHGNVEVGLEDPPSDLDATALAAGDAPVVQTADASVRGLSSGSVEQFLGIPYAEPPVGALRFRPPVPLLLAGELNATTFGSECLQGTATDPVGDESCLFLNVYRPANVDASQRLPVMFWIHGGSFTSGAGSDYDPRRLVKTNGVIVVTINYRLGPLGFLALPALSGEAGDGLSGDYGLMDQQEALRWVKANIATFGGDPARVTIAGESAGGASVCAQLTSPLASGLFSQAIIQSASCIALGVADAERFGTDTAAAIGCSTPTDHLTCLRDDKTAADIVYKGTGVYGVVAGGNLLPTEPDAVVRTGLPRPVPVLIGSLRDEIAFFAAYFPAYFGLTAADYAPTLAALFPALETSEITTRYPIEGRPAPQPFFAISAVASDSGFFYGSPTFIYSQALGGCVTSRLADALSSSTTTFAYELDDPSFTWATQTTQSPLLKGASHTSDLPFLFELDAPLSQPFNDAQNNLADQMVRAWGAFVATGDPSTTTNPWPAYTAAAPTLLHLEPSAVSTTHDFRERHHCDFWKTSLALR
jgi:para-nitrobenzyl esterase